MDLLLKLPSNVLYLQSKRQGKTGGPPSARGGSPQPVLALSLLNYMMVSDCGMGEWGYGGID